MENTTDVSTRAEKESPGRCTLPGIRYLFVFMSFTGMCFIFAVRVNLCIAIVAMVNQSAYENLSTTGGCHILKVKPENISYPVLTEPKDGDFYWSPATQGLVLGSFYYLYSVTQIPGGRLSEVYSGKYVFIGGLGLSLLFTVLTPLAAYHSVATLIAVRVMEGVAQGVTFPAIFNLMGRWLPNSEKSFLQNIIVNGMNVGSFVSMLVTGRLSNSNIFGGWPAAFYLFGFFGLIFCVLWCLLITDSPRNHPCISAKELEYIIGNQTVDETIELPPIPWKKILTSYPVWSVTIAQIGIDWCYYTLLNDLPVFFSTILHFEIEQNGFLSSFPYLLQAIAAIVSGWVSDIIIRKRIVTVNCARKFFNSVATVGAVLGLTGVIFSGCHVVAHIVFFTISITISGFCYSGYLLVILDLSPEYAGTIMGMMNTLSTLSGFLTTVIVGHLTNKQQTIYQWRIVFAITIVILLVSNAIFLHGSTSKKQMWHLQDDKTSFSFTTGEAALKTDREDS